MLVKLCFFLHFISDFIPLDPDPDPDSESGSGSTDPNESGSDRIRIRIHITGIQRIQADSGYRETVDIVDTDGEWREYITDGQWDTGKQ